MTTAIGTGAGRTRHVVAAFSGVEAHLGTRQPITVLAHHLSRARDSSRAKLGRLRAVASKGD